MSRNQVIVRSMYLFGDRLVRDIYKGGLDELYGFMYPHGGPLLGYTLVADSFLDSGFGAEAMQAYDRAIAAVDADLRKREENQGRARDIESLQARRENLMKRRESALVIQ
jgi:hypothetical protein